MPVTPGIPRVSDLSFCSVCTLTLLMACNMISLCLKTFISITNNKYTINVVVYIAMLWDIKYLYLHTYVALGKHCDPLYLSTC